MIWLDRNDWKIVNLSFVLPGLYLNILITVEILQFWDKKFSTCVARHFSARSQKRKKRYSNSLKEPQTRVNVALSCGMHRLPGASPWTDKGLEEAGLEFRSKGVPRWFKRDPRALRGSLRDANKQSISLLLYVVLAFSRLFRHSLVSWNRVRTLLLLRAPTWPGGIRGAISLCARFPTARHVKFLDVGQWWDTATEFFFSFFFFFLPLKQGARSRRIPDGGSSRIIIGSARSFEFFPNIRPFL